jgi:very-short-patch-repair endonuclease
VLRLTDPLSLPDTLARYPGHRGVARLRAIVAGGRVGAALTRSELEERFLEFVASARLPRPEVNVPVQAAGAWIEVDCLWRAQRVVAELDGRAVHATGTAFERDRARDRALQVAGWRPVRVTWRQLAREPLALEADLRVLLAVTT